MLARWRIIVWITVAVVVTAVASPPAHAAPVPAEELEVLGIQAYRAVLFSAQSYRDPGIVDLQTPNTDVAQLGRILRERYGFDVEVVQDAQHEQIIATLDRLAREVGEDDAVLIYYAGHGVLRREEDRGYWLPVDATPETTARWVSTDDVAAKVRAIPARHVLVVADSCFSGELTRALDVAVPSPEGPPGLAEAARLARQRSRWVITSGANEPVSDGGADGMSVFGYFFREALQGTEERYVTPDALFPAIRSAVAENSAQTPTQGKIAKGMQGFGQMVMINLEGTSCTTRLELDRQGVARNAEREWQDIVVPALDAGTRDDALAVVDDWIHRWGSYTLEGCGDEVPVVPERLGEARSVRVGLLNPPPLLERQRRRWPLFAGVSGGVVAAGGGALVATSGLWWSSQESAFFVQDGQIGAPDAELASTFRTMRTLNIVGGAAVAAGMAVVSVGGFGVALGDRGHPVLAWRMTLR